MSDLIERLKRMHRGYTVLNPIATLRDAVDRIEKLEAVAEAAKTFTHSYEVFFESQGGLVGHRMQTFGKSDLCGELKRALSALDGGSDEAQ